MYYEDPRKKLSEIPRPLKRIVDDFFNQDLEVLNLDKVDFHTFRHTFASLIVQNGVDIYIAKKLSNHLSIESTIDMKKLLQIID
nr:tyrosine-type recombinase/integrase [Malaciobacter halophilus]